MFSEKTTEKRIFENARNGSEAEARATDDAAEARAEATRATSERLRFGSALAEQLYHYVRLRLADGEVRHVQFDGSLRGQGTALNELYAPHNRRVQEAGSSYFKTAEGTLVPEWAVVEVSLDLDRDKPVKPIVEGDAAINA